MYSGCEINLRNEDNEHCDVTYDKVFSVPCFRFCGRGIVFGGMWGGVGGVLLNQLASFRLARGNELIT